jgi:hemin uptake protein HemP
MNSFAPNDKDKKTSTSRSEDSSPRTVPLLDARLDSRDLFIGTREITIAHGTDIYRLRLTAQNKLILTK